MSCTITYITRDELSKQNIKVSMFMTGDHFVLIDLSSIYGMGQTIDIKEHVDELINMVHSTFGVRPARLTIPPVIYVGFTDQAHAMHFKLNFRM